MPRLTEPPSAPEAGPDTLQPAESEASPPTVYCPSCTSKGTLLPSRRVWCPRCKTLSQVRVGGSALPIATVIGVILLLGFVFFYVQGAFDSLLYNVGLNWESCGLRNGEVLCGEQFRVGTDAVTESVKEGVKSWL